MPKPGDNKRNTRKPGPRPFLRKSNVSFCTIGRRQCRGSTSHLQQPTRFPLPHATSLSNKPLALWYTRTWYTITIYQPYLSFNDIEWLKAGNSLRCYYHKARTSSLLRKTTAVGINFRASSFLPISCQLHTVTRRTSEHKSPAQKNSSVSRTNRQRSLTHRADLSSPITRFLGLN